MKKANSPFLLVKPKSYLYGQKSLELALVADQSAADTDLTIYFAYPYADIRLIKANTKHVIVCAQSLDPLTPSQGVGHMLPESLKEAGADDSYTTETVKTLPEVTHDVLAMIASRARFLAEIKTGKPAPEKERSR